MRCTKALLKRNHNFAPGPGALFPVVMQRAQEQFRNFMGTGFGVIETTNLDATGSSHPGIPKVPVQHMLHETTLKLKKTLDVPDNYRIIFMSGGAVGQFSSIPLNFAFDGYTEGVKPKADIVPVGYWSTRTRTETEKYCDVHYVLPHCVGTVPPVSKWNIRPDTQYVHITLNETVEGLEICKEPDYVAAVLPPLIADATCTLLSRPVDIAKYGAIYASGGKNIPHGITVMIVREDLLLRKAHPFCPAVLHFNSHGAAIMPVGSAHDSIPNTPPVFPAWMLGLILDHIEERGGLQAMERQSIERANKLYGVIDDSQGFYFNPNDPEYRSRMSIGFRISKKGGQGEDQFDRELEKAFLTEAEAEGFHYTFGHPVKGGMRATCYIGQTDEAVADLAEFMQQFRAKSS